MSAIKREIQPTCGDTSLIPGVGLSTISAGAAVFAQPGSPHSPNERGTGCPTEADRRPATRDDIDISAL